MQKQRFILYCTTALVGLAVADATFWVLRGNAASAANRLDRAGTLPLAQGANFCGGSGSPQCRICNRVSDVMQSVREQLAGVAIEEHMNRGSHMVAQRFDESGCDVAEDKPAMPDRRPSNVTIVRHGMEEIDVEMPDGTGLQFWTFGNDNGNGERAVTVGHEFLCRGIGTHDTSAGDAGMAEARIGVTV